MAAVAVLATAVAGCSSPVSLPPDAPSAPGGGAALRVTRIVDGDTIWVDHAGRRLKVRLIGVDTPETRHPRVGLQCFGREATEFLRELLEDETVRLTYDVERTDRYGRDLAYVHRARDQLFVNRELLLHGYARLLTVPPNVAYVEDLVAAQRVARRASVGLWRECGLGS